MSVRWLRPVVCTCSPSWDRHATSTSVYTKAPPAAIIWRVGDAAIRVRLPGNSQVEVRPVDVRHHETPDALDGRRDVCRARRGVAPARHRGGRPPDVPQGSAALRRERPQRLAHRAASAARSRCSAPRRPVSARCSPVIRPPDVLRRGVAVGRWHRARRRPRRSRTRARWRCRADAFIELVHSNPAILDAVMQSLGSLIRRLTEQHADHIFLDLPGRVAKTLVRLAGDSPRRW